MLLRGPTKSNLSKREGKVNKFGDGAKWSAQLSSAVKVDFHERRNQVTMAG
jgi:hypothetical protein